MNRTIDMSFAIPEDWDDAQYLERYPDVRRAVKAGALSSGFQHFMQYGLLEGREPAHVISSGAPLPWPWSDALYLEANPDLRDALSTTNLTPAAHYVQFGEAERRSTGLDPLSRALIEQHSFPSWVVDEMFALSYYEPGLDPQAYTNPWVFDPFNKKDWGAQFLKIAEHLTYDKYDFLFLLPWLKPGGADLAALYHIQSTARHYSRVLVLTTEDSESEWSSRLPRTVDYVPLGQVLRGIDPAFQIKLCYYLISALQPAGTHVINSHLGWTMLARNSRALASLTRLYVSLYCYDYDVRGEPVGYARQIRSCIDAISAIFTDNTAFARHLNEDLGVPTDKVRVLRHPVNDPRTVRSIPASSNRILWASRLDRQKQPEILVSIAKQLPGLTFDVYGSAVMQNSDDILAALSSVGNIRYRGPFDSPRTLLSGDYRCFLYTSLWDGLPNIVLEMLSAGMLVVAPEVGGIGDDIGSDKCVLVRNARSADQYVEALRWIYQHPAEAETIRLTGHRYVRNTYDWSHFEAALLEAGYLNHAAEVR